MTFLGAGIGYRREHRDALLSATGAEKPAVLEVIAGHFFADPSALEPLAERYPIVLHEVGLSLGTASGHGDELFRATVQRVRAVARVARPALFSDHLALTRSPSGTDLGHLAPVWYTEQALAGISARVRELQDVLGVPVALENIAAPFVVPEAEMSEPEFFHRLVTETGCGLLLDLTNLVVNAKNFGFDPRARLLEYPLEAAWQIHLAGATQRHGQWIDSHSAAVDDESLSLLAALRGRAKLRAIIVERDEKIPLASELVGEANRAAEIWETGK